MNVWLLLSRFFTGRSGTEFASVVLWNMEDNCVETYTLPKEVYDALKMSEYLPQPDSTKFPIVFLGTEKRDGRQNIVSLEETKHFVSIKPS